MRLGRVLPYLMLLMILLGGLPGFTPTAQGIIVGTGVYFVTNCIGGGTTNYSVNHTMPFSIITINPYNITFNTTKFEAYNTGHTNNYIKIIEINESITGASNLDKVLEFNYTSTSSFNFQLSGFKTSTSYRISKNDVYWSHPTSNAAGVLIWRTSTTTGTVNIKIYDDSTAAPPVNNPRSVKANWTTSTSINLTWTKGTGTTNTYVVRKVGSYPSSLVDGTLVYNGPLTYFNDTSKSPIIRYYYTLYAEQAGAYSSGMQVKLVETDNTTDTTSASALFKGYLTTDKSMWTNFHYSSSSTFATTSMNNTVVEESQNTTGSFNFPFRGSSWMGQTFRTGLTHRYYLYNVSFKLYRYGNPGTLYIYLYSANATGLPSGAVLATGSYDSSTITTDPAGEWVNITMPSYYLLTNTEYAVMAYCDGSAANYLRSQCSDVSLYPDGVLTQSTNMGVTFSNYTGNDAPFRIYGHYPVTYGAGGLITSNETITGSGAFDILQGGFTAGHPYWYRATSNDTGSQNMTQGNTRHTLTNPEVPTFMRLTPYFANNSINISWLLGSGANRTIAVRSFTGYPTTISDGLIVYNGTATHVWIHNITFNLTYYFSLFAFTVWGDMSRFSSGVHVPWGGLTINVYNESKPWQKVNFSLLVTNYNLDTYYATGILGPYTLNTTSIPYGTHTLFTISNSSYRTRNSYINIYANVFYNLTFYLPPIIIPGGDTPEENYTYLYHLTVNDQLERPVDNVSIEVKRYFNYTDSYEDIANLLSDAGGQTDVYLEPSVTYYFMLTKAGYQDSAVFWTTTPYVFTHVFTLIYGTANGSTTYLFGENIITSGYLNNISSHVFVNYSNLLVDTLNCQVYVYEINSSNTTNTLVYTYNSFATDIFQFDFLVQHKTNDFLVVFHMNSTYFGHHTWSFIITGYHLGSGRTITTMSKFNLLFMANFGWCPVGWSNLITWFIMLGCFFSFERRDSYMILLLAGFLLLVFNYYIGFNTTMALVAGGALPVVMIVFAILMLIRDRNISGAGS